MSFFVTRPPSPVPGTSDTSTLCSAAILRTSGVERRRRRSSAVSTPPPSTRPAGGAAAAAGESLRTRRPLLPSLLLLLFLFSAAPFFTAIAQDRPAYQAISWSRDGSQLALTARVGGGYQVTLVSLDRGVPVPLIDEPSSSMYAAWSPDGSRIAFSSDRDGNPDIYLTPAERGDLTRLTSHAAADLYPTWSPDGSRIAFFSNRNGNWQLYVMSADGSDVRQLTSHAGNLPRPDDLWSMLLARDSGQPHDPEAISHRVRAAVAETVREQAEVGIDIVNDGEQSKRSWQTYVVSRLSGLEQRPARPGEGTVGQSITAREAAVQGFQAGGGNDTPESVDRFTHVARSALACSSSICHVTHCEDPPVKSSPPAGPWNTRVGAQREENANEEATRRFPGRDASSIVAPTSTV